MTQNSPFVDEAIKIAASQQMSPVPKVRKGKIPINVTALIKKEQEKRAGTGVNDAGRLGFENRAPGAKTRTPMRVYKGRTLAAGTALTALGGYGAYKAHRAWKQHKAQQAQHAQFQQKAAEVHPAIVEGLVGAGAGAGVGALSAMRRPKGERARAAKRRALVGAGVGGALGVGTGHVLRGRSDAEAQGLWAGLREREDHLKSEMASSRRWENAGQRSFDRRVEQLSGPGKANPLIRSEQRVFPSSEALHQRLMATGLDDPEAIIGVPPRARAFGRTHPKSEKWLRKAKNRTRKADLPFDPDKDAWTRVWESEKAAASAYHKLLTGIEATRPYAAGAGAGGALGLGAHEFLRGEEPATLKGRLIWGGVGAGAGLIDRKLREDAKKKGIAKEAFAASVDGRMNGMAGIKRPQFPTKGSQAVQMKQLNKLQTAGPSPTPTNNQQAAVPRPGNVIPG